MTQPTRTAELTLFFGDGEHRFAMRIGELIELDQKFQIGPMVMMQGFLDGSWRVEWVREVLRIGLIGGGMLPSRASDVVKRYVDEVPDWLENSKKALAVLGAAMTGFEAEQPGKSKGAKTARTRRTKIPAGASASPRTTPGQQ
jgi:hypothetical protein